MLIINLLPELKIPIDFHRATQ